MRGHAASHLAGPEAGEPRSHTHTGSTRCLSQRLIELPCGSCSLSLTPPPPPLFLSFISSTALCRLHPSLSFSISFNEHHPPSLPLQSSFNLSSSPPAPCLSLLLSSLTRSPLVVPKIPASSVRPPAASSQFAPRSLFLWRETCASAACTHPASWSESPPLDAQGGPTLRWSSAS